VHRERCARRGRRVDDARLGHHPRSDGRRCRAARECGTGARGRGSRCDERRAAGRARGGRAAVGRRLEEPRARRDGAARARSGGTQAAARASTVRARGAQARRAHVGESPALHRRHPRHARRRAANPRRSVRGRDDHAVSRVRHSQRVPPDDDPRRHRSGGARAEQRGARASEARLLLVAGTRVDAERVRRREPRLPPVGRAAGGGPAALRGRAHDRADAAIDGALVGHELRGTDPRGAARAARRRG